MVKRYVLNKEINKFLQVICLWQKQQLFKETDVVHRIILLFVEQSFWSQSSLSLEAQRFP